MPGKSDHLTVQIEVACDQSGTIAIIHVHFASDCTVVLSASIFVRWSRLSREIVLEEHSPPPSWIGSLVRIDMTLSFDSNDHVSTDAHEWFDKSFEGNFLDIDEYRLFLDQEWNLSVILLMYLWMPLVRCNIFATYMDRKSCCVQKRRPTPGKSPTMTTTI